MKKKRRSSRRTSEGIIWAIVVGLMALGGLMLCARYQGNIHSGGMRLMLIVGAVLVGAGAGLLIDRLTGSRRSGRSAGPNRRTRRHIRTVAFAITGIVAASCLVAGYMVHQSWIIYSVAAGVLLATWIWYFVENYRLSRGTRPGHPPDHRG